MDSWDAASEQNEDFKLNRPQTSGLAELQKISADNVNLRQQALALAVQHAPAGAAIAYAEKYLAFLSGSSSTSSLNDEQIETFAREHAENGKLRKEIIRLAGFIATSIPGEPSQGEGAVDTAIRIMRSGEDLVESLRDQLSDERREVTKLQKRIIKARGFLDSNSSAFKTLRGDFDE